MRGQHDRHRGVSNQLSQPGVDIDVRAQQQRDDHSRELVVVLCLRPVWQQAIRQRLLIPVEIADTDVDSGAGEPGCSGDPEADLVGVGLGLSGNGDHEGRRVRRDREPVRTAVAAGWAGPGGPSRQCAGAIISRPALGEAASLGEAAGVALGQSAGAVVSRRALGEAAGVALGEAASLGEAAGVALGQSAGVALGQSAALGEVAGAALGEVAGAALGESAALGQSAGVALRQSRLVLRTVIIRRLRPPHG